jgi:hypothetical protein
VAILNFGYGVTAFFLNSEPCKSPAADPQAASLNFVSFAAQVGLLETFFTADLQEPEYRSREGDTKLDDSQSGVRTTS